MFYAATQALLYVLCYRLPHIMELGAAAPMPHENGDKDPPNRAVEGTEAGSGAGQTAGAAEARALRQLLRSIMPQLLGHRFAVR